MAYEQQETKRVTTDQSVRVDHPTTEREVVRTDSVYLPEKRGFSGLAVAAMVIGAIAVVTVLFMVLSTRQAADANANRVATREAQQQQLQPPPPQQIIVQPPAQQQPVVIQQPAPAPAPVVVPQPASSSANSAEWDNWIQAEFQRQMTSDDRFATLGVTATSVARTVTLTGTVSAAKTKSDIESLVRGIKGVKSVDNQILVSGG